jgi:hypothetical protein
MTLAQVARDARIDVRTLRALIAGDRWPTEKVRGRVEKALGWRPGEITRQAYDGIPALATYSDEQLLSEMLHRTLRRRGRSGH